MPVQVLMPALSPTMTEGTLSKWHKKVGDTVQSGDVLAEIETDKATMEIEAVEEGKLAKILVDEGTSGVAVNTLIALILEDDEDESALEGAESAASKPVAAPQPSPEAAPAQAASSAAPAQKPATDGNRTIASPLARRMAEQAGLDLGTLSGTGPNGRVVKSDIEQALQGGTPKAQAPAQETTAAKAAPQPAPAQAQTQVPATVSSGSYTDEPVSMMRKVIAERLTESKQTIPHFYLTVDCEIDALLAMRKDLNDRAPKGDDGYKLSVNDFVVRAVALAMRRFPTVNASWQGDFIRKFHRVDISIAVATKSGLITPVVRDADNKGLAQVSGEIKELAGRAQDGDLLPEEYQGGGFTISNLGMYDVKEFSAIINPPQSAILAVATGKQQPVVKSGALAIATVMSCTLSADHRVVDGAVGAEFMAAFKKLIEEPLTMML